MCRRPCRISPGPTISPRVEKAKDYIRAGDIFQVVPIAALDAGVSRAAFRALPRAAPHQPLALHVLLQLRSVPGRGCKPRESSVRVFGGEVTIRPIAGTRKRGATPEEDRALEADLLSDQKELAEHLMLLDLGRNDVGRVARIGTVRPDRGIHRRAL